MGLFTRKRSIEESSENGSPALEEGRWSSSVRSEANQSTDSVDEPALPNTTKRNLRFYSEESSLGGRLRRLKKSWFQRCNKTCFGFLLALSAILILLALLIYFNITLRRAIPKNDIQRTVASWGQAGSPAETQEKLPTDFSHDIRPIPCHSHNDYTRDVPLYDALAAGCTGVEADIWLTNDDLLVGHSSSSLSPSRTLQSLYINPLLSIISHQNPPLLPNTTTSNPPKSTTPLNGIFSANTSTPLTLLIDIKTSGPTTLPHLLQQLEPLHTAGYLTHHDGHALTTGPLTIVCTGNTPFEPTFSTPANTTAPRYVFFDAPLADLWSEDAPANNTLYNSENSNYASTDFDKAIGKVHYGMLSPSQVEMVRMQAAEARRRGLKARYWNTPSWPVGVREHVWDVLVKEGVGMLNVDDLEGAARRSWRTG